MIPVGNAMDLAHVKTTAGRNHLSATAIPRGAIVKMHQKAGKT